MNDNNFNFELNKSIWTYSDGIEFLTFLNSVSNVEKVAFAKKVINTRKTMIGIQTPALRSIANEIAKGNFESFLDLELHDYYEVELIDCLLICKIKDWKNKSARLTRYAENADCWAEIDIVSLKKDKNKDEIFEYATLLTKSDKTFVRRMGIILLFDFVNEKYFDKIIEVLRPLKSETEYYVNMAVAWLMCELVVKLPDLAVKYVNRDFLNDFTLKKSISKCSDSYRVPKERVELLRKSLK